MKKLQLTKTMFYMKPLLASGLIASSGIAYATDALLSIDTGSNFTMEVSPGFHLPTSITGLPGSGINTVAPSSLSSGSHGGAPDGSESPTIDNPWSFFTNTGMHGSTGQLTMTPDGANGATMDMSGWYVHWNNVQIDMSSGAWGSNPSGVADITCSSVNCDSGTYTLTYTATVPDDGSTNFGNVHYGLNLVGTISSVPVPAAAWLFGSGLLGLVGVARRKAKA